MVQYLFICSNMVCFIKFEQLIFIFYYNVFFFLVFLFSVKMFLSGILIFHQLMLYIYTVNF